jgi:hypothetical protein
MGGMDKRPCPHCATPIGAEFKACPHCGQSFETPPPASSQDLEHLRLLSIFHLVFAGILGFFSCFPLIHVAVGAIALVAGSTSSDGAPGIVVGLFFMLIGGCFVLAGWTVAGFLFYAGRCLQQRRRLTLCTVVAAVSCAFMPLGTILGVFTLITLNKPSVKILFESAAPPVSHPGGESA